MAHRNYFNLPENLVEILVQPLEEIPSGHWRDFNKLHKFWQILKNNSDNDNACSKELLLLEDVPDEPKVSDYPDLND
jgi:hypothetical protein